MPIDLRSETPIRLSDVPDLPCIPRRRKGRKLHKSTAFRWVRTGVRGVRLEAIRTGGTLCTSVATLQRFFERLAGLLAPERPQTARQHRQRLQAVERELDREGV